MTDRPNPGLRSLVHTLRRPPLFRTTNLAVLALPLCLLVACGGGSEESAPAPTLVRVDTPPRALAAASGVASTGIERSGTLNYQVWSSGDVAAGSGTAASAQVTAVPVYFHEGGLRYYDSSITFAPGGPFPSGLHIADAHRGPSWPTDSPDLMVVKGGGVSTTTWPTSHTMWSGSLLSLGNYFVFCSAGAATPSVSEQAARTGAQVAVSSRFEPMDNLAPLYGKSFYRYDCAGTTSKTTFGDGQGHLTMVSDGISLNEAETVQAFSSAGYAPAAGQIIKRRAYSIVINGVTRTVVVALDNRGTPYASVLFQLES